MEGFAFWAGYGPWGFHLDHQTHIVPLPLQRSGVIIYDVSSHMSKEAK